jgi:S1-C subfamily serine protease
MTAMDKYFVVEPGAEPHGPYPLPEIADLLASGTVTPRAILRKAGDASAPPRPTVIDVAPIEPMRPAAPPPSPPPSPPVEVAPPPVSQPPPVPESAKAPAAKAMMEKAKRVGPPPGVTLPQSAIVAPPPVIVAPPTAVSPPPVIVTPVIVTSPAQPEPHVEIDMTNPVDQLDDGWEGETEIHDEQPAYVSPNAAPAAPTFVPPQASQPHSAPHAHAASYAEAAPHAHAASYAQAAPLGAPHAHAASYADNAPHAHAAPYAAPAHASQRHRAPRGTQPPPTAWPADPAITQPSMSLAVINDKPRRKLEPAPAPEQAPAPQQLAPVAQHLVKPAEDPPPVREPKKKLLIGIGIGVAALAVGGVAIAMVVGGGKNTSVKDALVRVSTPSGTGTGFLINGPDEYIYVATANHLVDRGERVLVERDVNVSDKKHYVEAYPETEIVATDPDADLAVIRVKNVEARRFSRLPLAKEPVKDAKIFSYGYPGSSLAKKAGLVSKDGKILSIVRFPAYDDRYARVLRENAVDGLLVSTDIEPGFSGGPTTNEAGEVVGINVTKDRAHVGQNGAVSVAALRELMKKVKPAKQQVEPKAEDIVALLKKVQSEYLLLPLEERSRIRETDFLSASDLPALRRFVNEIRREERNTDNAFIAKLRLSGQAALGMYFARLPGNLLETYRAPSTKTAITACALANQRLASFFGELDAGVGKRRQQPRDRDLVDTCDELGVRPLAWDLAAATLQWDGKEREYTVTKIDRMDDDGRVFRASVRMSGASNLIELWFGIEQGQPRLKLFDTTDNLYAIDSPRTVSTSALQGTWAMKRPRVTDSVDKDAEVESEDKVSISIGEEQRVSILYTTTQKYYAVTKRSSFPCNRKGSMEVGLAQSFVGTLENGVVIALPEKVATPVGADAGYCLNRRLPDQIIAVKLVGDQLYLYRTDGSAYPETLQLAKI